MYSLWRSATDLSPEQKLWRIVVLVLIQDIQIAYNDYRNSMNGSRGRHYSLIKKLVYEAEHEWTKEICAMAGLDHDMMMGQIYRICEGELEVKTFRRLES
jgi:hypothetical protein